MSSVLKSFMPSSAVSGVSETAESSAASSSSDVSVTSLSSKAGASKLKSSEPIVGMSERSSRPSMVSVVSSCAVSV